MFSWKSWSRHNYAKTVLSEFTRQQNLSDEAVGRMALNMGATTDALVEIGVLNLKPNTQPTASLLEALDKMSYMPVGSKDEKHAQLCIKFAKGFSKMGIPEQMPSLLYAAFFKMLADKANSMRTGTSAKKLNGQLVYTGELRECLGALFNEFHIRFGELHAS